MMRCMLMLILASALFAQEVPVTRRRQLPIRLVTENIGQVVAATLWLSTDEGATWQQATTINRPQPADEPIVFRFQPDEERLYGFRTTEMLNDGRHEAAPTPGSKPQVSVIFDFTPPRIDVFDIAAISRRHDNRTIKMQWASDDSNPHDAAVRLQRADGDEWHALGEWLPPSGTMTITAPADAVLRLSVRDRAGNQTVSDAWHPPEDADLAMVDTAAPEDPEETAGPESTSAPATQDTADKASEPSAHEDQESDVAQVAMPTFGEDDAHPTLAPDIERDFQTALRARRAAREAQRPPRVADEKDRRDADTASRLPATPTDDTPPATLLRLARKAMAAGDDHQALSLYRRLANSSLSSIGLAEELALMERLGHRREALELARISPPEALSDSVRCIQARLMLALRDHEGARRVLRHIPLDSPQRREAQLLEAQLLFATGDRAAARAILRILARGDDGWAAAARTLLGP